MVYWSMFILVVVQGCIIGALLAALRVAREEREAALKWAAKREMLRKFWEDQG